MSPRLNPLVLITLLTVPACFAEPGPDAEQMDAGGADAGGPAVH